MKEEKVNNIVIKPLRVARRITWVVKLLATQINKQGDRNSDSRPSKH